MMKHTFHILTVSLCVCSVLSSCVREKNPYANEAAPDLTITAEASSFVQDQAQLELNLSQFIHKDVVVAFDVQGIDRGALDLPESYAFPAGTVKQTLRINAYSADLAPAEYSVVITPTSEVAKIVSSPISLALSVKDLAYVNLSMTPFDDNNKSVVTISLSRGITEAVTLPIKVEGLPEGAVTYEKNITVPKGEREVKTEVALNLSGVEAGVYNFSYQIASYSAKVQAGTNAVLEQTVRAGIVLKRHPWYEEEYWDFYNGRVYTYGGLGAGISRLALLCLKKSEMPDVNDSAALIEFLGELGETLNESNTYVAPATESNYIWFPNTIAPDNTARTFYFMLIGLDETCRPTGDYDYFEYINEDGLDLVVNSTWSWGYYSGWYYVYASGMNATYFTVMDVSQSKGSSSDPAFVISQLFAGSALVKAGTLSAYNNDSFAGASYKYLYSPSLSAGTYYAILFAMDGDYNPTGEYSLKPMTVSE